MKPAPANRTADRLKIRSRGRGTSTVAQAEPGANLSLVPPDPRSGLLNRLPALLPARGTSLGLAAFALGCGGEVLLFHPSVRPLGAALLLVAMALAALAWGNVLHAASRTEHSTPSTQHSALAWRVAGVAVALVVAAGSMVAWFAKPDAAFGWQGALWLASIVLLTAACARWRVKGDDEAAVGPLWTRWEVGVFAGILALSLLTHLVWLNDIPWRFQLDETVAYIEAMRFYKGPPISMFSTTWYGTGLPSLFFVFAGGFLHITGVSLGGIRAPVALVGALTTIPVYGLGRLLAGRLAAALAALSSATTAVILHYSRVSIINMTTPFAWALCFYFLLKGYRSRRPADFMWAGLVGGLSMYTYYGARLLPYMLVAIALYLLVFHFHDFRERAGLFSLVPVAFIVGFGPLLAYFIRNPEVWAGRGLGQLNVPASLPATLHGWLADWNVLAPLAWQNFLGFSVIRNNDAFYWAPLLLPIEAVLMLLGVGVLIWCWRRVEAFVVLLWGVSVFFVGGVLIGDVHIPAFVHLTPAFPVLSLAVALPPALWLKSLSTASTNRQGSDTTPSTAGPFPGLAGKLGPSVVRSIAYMAVAAGALALAAGNLYFYLVSYPPTVPPSFESAQGRLLESLQARAQQTPTRVRFVGDSWKIFSPELKVLLAPDVEAGDFLNPSRELPLVADPAHDDQFLFNDDEVQYLPVVEEYYPGGRAAPLATPGGPIGETYTITAAQEMSRHGVFLTVEKADGSGKTEWQGGVARVGSLPAGLNISYPARATWSGEFDLPRSQQVKFEIVGSSTRSLLVNGVSVAQGGVVALDEGWVPFALQVDLLGPSQVTLLVQEGTGAPEEIDKGHLWPKSPEQGLALSYDGGASGHRLDPFLGGSILSASGGTFNGFLAPPTKRDLDFIPVAPNGTSLARWQGEVYAEGGTYRMEARTDARVVMLIDGKPVLKLCASKPLSMQDRYHGVFNGGVTSVVLSAGWHAVQLDEQASGDANGLEWTWTRPDGVREIVPPSRLRYPADASGVALWPTMPTSLACP